MRRRPRSRPQGQGGLDGKRKKGLFVSMRQPFLPGHSSHRPSSMSSSISLLMFSSPDLIILPQVHDDAGLLACGTLSETYLQAVSRRPGPHRGLDLQPGEAGPSWTSGHRQSGRSRRSKLPPGGECRTHCSLVSPGTGVPGPVDAPGPVLPQFS